MNATKALQAGFKNNNEMFLDTLQLYTILDIGTIESVNNKGRAVVRSSVFIEGEQVIYQDAEVIYPGNTKGCYTADCSGSACLIFIPRTCMPNTENLKIRFNAPAYNKDGVKVLPIGNGSNDSVRTHFSAAGNFLIEALKYSIQCSGKDITLQTIDGTVDISMDNTGQLYVRRLCDNGSFNVNIEDTGVTKTWLSKNKDVLWTDTLNPDGSRSFVQTNPNDEEADPLFSMTIRADGVVTFNMVSGVSLITKDTLTLKGKSVTVEATDGSVDITASKDQEANAGAITVTTSNNKTFSVNGDNLVVDA